MIMVSGWGAERPGEEKTERGAVRAVSMGSGIKKVGQVCRDAFVCPVSYPRRPGYVTIICSFSW